MFSNHPRAQRWSPKNDVDVDTISMNSHKKFWFDCDKCHHIFETSPNSISSLKRWCPYCTNQKLCDNENCNYCFDKSFASHEFAQYWIQEKNDKTPREVFLGSKKKYWFKCDTCNHDFEKPLKRIKATGGWCYYCTSDSLCDDEDCDYCFDKSLASDDRVEHFKESNSGKTPRYIVKKGKEICTFECDTCKHLFSIKIGNVIMLNQWCGYCGSKRWCDNECEKCFAVSFGSHERAQYIVDKSIDLSRVRRSGKDKYDFKCEKCNNIFSKYLGDVVRGSWCPKCVNKTEKKLFDILSKIYDDIEFQKRFDWCKSPLNHIYPFDYCIASKKIIIELDGDQHFKNVHNWLPCIEQKKRDVFKMIQANKNGYSVIRIRQPDVLADKNNWKNDLIYSINAIDTFEDITNIYITNNDIYDDHINCMETSNLALNVIC